MHVILYEFLHMLSKNATQYLNDIPKKISFLLHILSQKTHQNTLNFIPDYEQTAVYMVLNISALK